MRKVFKKAISVLLVAVMVFGAAPLSGLTGIDFGDLFPMKASAATITSFKQGDIIEFGWYPQSEVTDSSIISELNSLAGDNKSWTSYGYYSGTSSLYDGQMTAKDYMRYKDIVYGSNKYRGVVFDTYRHYNTGYVTDTSVSNTYQDNNGYTCGTVYWFKYEPIEWCVLDPATGMVIAETILDSQAYNNYVLYNGIDEYGYSAFWGDSTQSYYSNNYEKSSIREWLNENFYNTAFSDEQQNIIEYTALDNSAYSESYSAYDSETTYDKIYLLSYDDPLNTNYGFDSNAARTAQGSDYAKCHGMQVYGGNSDWWLRTPGNNSNYACYVNDIGYVRHSGLSVNYYYIGVRPALNFNLTSEIFQSDVEDTKEPEMESELAVVVEPLGGSYYLIDGGLYDQNLNNVSSLQYKVTVRNFYIAPTGTTLDEETKEKLKIENVSAAASLSDYSNLLIDIEALDELGNIGDLEVNESKTVIINVTPNGTEMPADGVSLDVTATADGKDSVSASTPIEIKDKLYDPQAVVSFNVFNQNITYKDKKYDSESIEVSVRVTNRIPSAFSGNVAKLKEISDCDITVSEIKISSDDSKLLSDAGIRTKELNTVLHAGESTVITGTYHINTKHKMDEKVESETVGFSCNVSTSANSPSASKSVTFINENYKNDTSISYEKTSVRNLFEEMRSELQKCDVLNGTEKSLVDYIITSHIMAMDLSDLKNILDATEKVYDLSSLISKLDKSYYEIAGEYVLDAILEEADKTEDGLKEIIEECMEALRDSEEFNTFIKWYYDQQNTKKNSNKRTDVRCPVDVYAYDESGKEVLSIIGNVIVKAEGDIHAFVCEDDKIIYFPTDTDYDIKIIATGNGTMDYIVTEYSSESELRKTVYEDIPLVVDEQYIGVVTKSTLPDAKSYNLISSDGTEFTYTEVKYVESDIDVQVDIPTPSTTTINYGDRIVLHANIEGELPAGYQIKWISSNNNFSMSVSADGKTCTISPESSGETVFTAVIVDENDNAVSSDEQTMTSKAGFFQKIIAFFKKLFGLTKTIPQSKMF